MIRGIFHKGSGVGNQLHRYVGSRCLALDSGHEWGMVAPELCKVSSFMNLYMGNSLSDYHIEEPADKVITHTTDLVVDGEFQGEEYFMHHIGKVREWLKVEPLDMPDDVCVINFRGGEFSLYPDLFLPQEYWNQAIIDMTERHGKQNGQHKAMRFEVHTDDIRTAKLFFPTFPIIQNVALNWRSIRYAKYLILANSSFAILPALLGDAKEIIAPKYWAGHNKGVWQLPENEYKRFTYL